MNASSENNQKPTIKKVCIIGDHSYCHCGSRAVIAYLKRLISLNCVIVDSWEESDVLIVNGEGSMHDNSKTCISKLEQIKLAQEERKKTYLVNTVWQNNPNIYDSVLRKLDGIFVREPSSQIDLKKNHNIDSSIRIDLSYFYDIFGNEKGQDLKKQACITDFYSRVFRGWVKYTVGSYSNLPYLDMRRFSWSEFVQTLETSSLLITGRHHAVVGACRARTPFIAVESNTHKISGFLKMSKIPIPVCETPAQLEQAIQWSRLNLTAYQEFFDFLDSQPKLSLSDLGLDSRKSNVETVIF